MANIYEIQKQIDDALVNAGYVVNQGDPASTDSITDDIRLYTRIDQIEQAEEQVGQHVTVEFDYTAEFVRGSSDTSASGIQARRIQAGTDWENIYKTIYSVTQSGNAETMRIDDGQLNVNTQKDYQSYGSVVVKVQHKFRIC